MYLSDLLPEQAPGTARASKPGIRTALPALPLSIEVLTMPSIEPEVDQADGVHDLTGAGRRRASGDQSRPHTDSRETTNTKAKAKTYPAANGSPATGLTRR